MHNPVLAYLFTYLFICLSIYLSISFSFALIFKVPGERSRGSRYRYPNYRDYLFRGTVLCILMFDVTNMASFEALSSWKDMFSQSRKPSDRNEIPFVVIGNGVDKEGERVVSRGQATEWCQAVGIDPLSCYFETSAVTGTGVAEAFIAASQLALKQQSGLSAPNADAADPADFAEPADPAANQSVAEEVIRKLVTTLPGSLVFAEDDVAVREALVDIYNAWFHPEGKF